MSAFAYRRRSPLSIPLRLLELAIAADSYESVLSALGSGIRAAESHGHHRFAASVLLRTSTFMAAFRMVVISFSLNALVSRVRAFFGTVMRHPVKGLRATLSASYVTKFSTPTAILKLFHRNNGRHLAQRDIRS